MERHWIVSNGAAGSADELEGLRARIRGRDSVRLVETAEQHSASDLAAEAARAGAERVIAAGGDGTINEVVQGLVEAKRECELGILPLGTGNDFARTLGIPEDLGEALDVAFGSVCSTVDVIRAKSGGETRHAINVCAGGFSGMVDEVLTPEMKSTWGPLAYLISAANVVPSIEHYDVKIAMDGEPVRKSSVLNVIVANGRTAAGGFQVAPTADPSDGLLDVLVIERGGVFDLARVAADLLRGALHENPSVFFARAREVEVHSKPGMWFNLDGELWTNEPVSFSVLPRRLQVAVSE